MMKNMKVSVLVAIIAVMVVFGAYQHGKLDAASSVAPAKIAIVNVTKVLEGSAKHKAWQEKMQADRQKMEGEFMKLKEELEAIQANLKLRTPGSEDHMKLQVQAMQKEAEMKAKDGYYQERVTVEMKQWTEDLYQQLLKTVDEVAKQKGLDIVMSDEILDIPSPSLRDFMLTVKTKKVLYHNEKYDITDEVLAALDK
ncbi:MAG: OmpH/Skp family outer membrane protein [Planctomycetota bacterium]|jgi:Skp family chaperone for outer membrane proteins